MSEGEHALITVTDPALLAAPEGAAVGGSVPVGTAAAVFDVKLVSFKKAKERWEMNNAEKVSGSVWVMRGVQGVGLHDDMPNKYPEK
jgi:hypothetical protein